jgi:protein-tyrosine phosphatase
VETSSNVRILTVCSGNICRSPVAERILQAGFDAVRPGAFRVRSAGTHAVVGAPVQLPSARIIESHGGRPDGFAARQLTPGMLRGADLILTMTAAHRSDVVGMDPSALKRTFTIREFARMLNALEARDAGPAPDADLFTWWKALPGRAAAVRHLALVQNAADNDVADPYRLGPEAYQRMEDELAPAVLTILGFAHRTAPAGV